MKFEVAIGTLLFEKGKFQKGETVELTEEEATRLKGLVVVLPEPAPTPEPVKEEPLMAAQVLPDRKSVV